MVEMHYPYLHEVHRRTLIGISNGCGGIFPYPPETDFVTDLTERCDDEIDNDGDGRIDCDDWDCFGVEPACTTEHNCSDGGDNDRDGMVDCDDPDCSGVPPCGEGARGLWESFDRRSSFDLTETVIFFLPDEEEPEGYFAFTEGGFPFFLEEPGEGDESRELGLGDDVSEEYELRLMDGVEFYGVRYRTFFVSSNGYITFGVGSSDTSANARAHFAHPAISGYRTDLNPGRGGNVFVDEWFDHVAVTFEDVPFFSGPGDARNSFQMILMEDGSLAIQYVEIGEHREGLVGVGDGNGDPYPEEIDFSSL